MRYLSGWRGFEARGLQWGRPIILPLSRARWRATWRWRGACGRRATCGSSRTIWSSPGEASYCLIHGVVLSFHANATALATALIPAEELEISGRANCGSVASASDSGDPLLRERLNPGAALLRERCPGRGSDGDARVTHLKIRAGGPELGAVIAGRATSPRSIASSAG